ncbi:MULTISPECIES: NAD(P)/FAD-dependent oxidoreductase [Pseudanabaena]|uniref:Glucose-inhibited division protein A n=2 Tax=Pseudanabaena TaxID=1152 RepID=L8N672_9CYAN|nr:MULTISPECIES: NAD(P)/FAD-dependent oxidoreductase [Pseudanabaena]ELS34205.1 glucose-inhibited division protein A [Pseudanabaena biceps PCC 7429]MDG3493566.1 NAD(P)/FAD-dependent oxidoreductase [Pseudanabaena catenata USMAC16]
MNYDAIAIGAGLSGCSAAIQLAKLGYRVLLLEQGNYPMHKLCGEFLSIEVTAAFENLGIWERVLKVGAHPIHRAYLTTSGGASFRSSLPSTALGLSRYQLDLILFQRAQDLNVTCLDNTKVTNVTGNLEAGFQVHTNKGNFSGRLVLGAFGKRSSLDRILDRPFSQKRSPWIAYKGHFTGVDIKDAIELHSFPNGYCGLSQIETGEINVCWIAHERVMKEPTHQDLGIPTSLAQNPVLADRFRQMERVSPSLQGLSQISFAIKENFYRDICMIGDTAGMITPLCGDGMAMALRSAEIAVPLVARFLEHQLTAIAFKHSYEKAWEKEFQTRLQLGRIMHHCFVRPSLAHTGVNLCQMLPNLGNWLIGATRGKPQPI